MRILIIAEHASFKFGGEASLPLHIFRRLRERGIEAWMIVHERTRAELEETLPEYKSFIYYVPDTRFAIVMGQISKLLPSHVSYFTFGFASRLLTQVHARRIARGLLKT